MKGKWWPEDVSVLRKGGEGRGMRERKKMEGDRGGDGGLRICVCVEVERKKGRKVRERRGKEER